LGHPVYIYIYTQLATTYAALFIFVYHATSVGHKIKTEHKNRQAGKHKEN